MIELCYQDTATFVKVSPSTSGYGDDKVVVEQADVLVMFIQNTGYSRSNFQDAIDSDAICYPDPTSIFITSNFNRLEGMYILEPLFGSGDDTSWYKITDVTVNRDILLDNQIDNIELKLKKTRPIAGVS